MQISKEHNNNLIFQRVFVRKLILFFQTGPSKPRNKLSKAYRFKKKIGKVKKQTDDNDFTTDQAKKPRIIVRNLSFKVL